MSSLKIESICLKDCGVATINQSIKTKLLKAKFHYAIWFEAGSKLVGNQLRTSFEPASVMEFGF